MTNSYTVSSPVTAWITPERKRIDIKGLKAGPVAFYVEGDEELTAVIEALMEAAGLFIHMPDGCEDDSCPCRQRKESQE